ncbi:hypothetical protein [Thiorhodococcus minor]|uniref:Uncharacterized protein n=1 Tax=Thiorhodococcus minor TaxID=57489 RepID=A0A6M0K9D4_9GAMM|nr:hypothetical protein [Thiorhodococcus minor]NEV65115.1 hypothetical protein [Thiorhodococcus minor]
MSKKPRTKKPSKDPKPSPERLKSIERLMQKRQCAQAVTKARGLVARFPAHGGVRQALLEALECAEGSQSAALAAFQWSQARPNSLPAQLTFLRHLNALAMPALGDRVARRIRDLGGSTPGYPLDDALLEIIQLA